MEISQAIIPAAGLGTRFLPATKITPKEMLPLLDKPAIQYVVEEAVRSGIKDFVMVLNKTKKSIEDHFDTLAELQNHLTSRNKQESLDSIARIIELARFAYVRQHEPRGLGHAVWSAKHVIGNKYVAIMLPDDIIMGPVPGLAQLMKIALQERCSVIAVQEVPLADVSRYGIINIKKQISPNLFQIRDVVEKPSQIEAPSNLAIVGRYILSPDIFDALEDSKTGALGEIQLTDGIQKLLLSGEKVFGYKLQGTHRYDVGTPLDWLKANIACALRHQAFGDDMLSYLIELDREMIVMEGKASNLSRQRSL